MQAKTKGLIYEVVILIAIGLLGFFAGKQYESNQRDREQMELGSMTVLAPTAMVRIVDESGNEIGSLDFRESGKSSHATILVVRVK